MGSQFRFFFVHSVGNLVYCTHTWKCATSESLNPTHIIQAGARAKENCKGWGEQMFEASEEEGQVQLKVVKWNRKEYTPRAHDETAKQSNSNSSRSSNVMRVWVLFNMLIEWTMVLDYNVLWVWRVLPWCGLHIIESILHVYIASSSSFDIHCSYHFTIYIHYTWVSLWILWVAPTQNEKKNNW